MIVGTKEKNTIENKINSYLIKCQKEHKNRERSGKWNPSLFGRCYRLQYWNRKDETKTNPPDERALRIFACGHLFHNYIEKLFDHTEQEIETNDVKGYADIVTEDCVWDIKSQHSRAFWYMNKSNYDITEEKYNNWLQVAYYALKLNKKYCGLVFVSKDDLCIKEYKVLAEKWQGEVTKELTTLRKMWKEDKLPLAKPRAYNGKGCKYCNWKDKCEEIENA